LHYNTRNANLIYKILGKREQHIDYSLSSFPKQHSDMGMENRPLSDDPIDSAGNSILQATRLLACDGVVGRGTSVTIPMEKA
jgi:hypothetical protein